MNPSLLLPREKYAEVSRTYDKNHATFEIANKRQILYYFGANHSPNHDNPQYPTLKEYWNKFLEATENKDRIVLVEGSLRRLIENEEEAIINGSEASFITLLAHRADVPVACPD